MNKPKQKQLGRVVSVTQTNNGMVACEVQLPHSGGAAENVAVGKPHAKAKWVPKPGWSVVVDYMNDGEPFITEVLSVPSKDFSSPKLSEGSMTFQFDDDTAITVDKDSNGNYTVDISGSGEVTVSGNKVTVDSAEKVSVTSETSVEVEAGSITLGTGGSDSTLITDISTTKDSDGHVTGVSAETTSKTSAE